MTPPPRDCQGICTNLPEVFSEIKEGVAGLRVEIREMRKLCPDHSSRIRAIEDQILQARTALWVGKKFWLCLGISLGYALKYLPALIAQAKSLGQP